MLHRISTRVGGAAEAQQLITALQHLGVPDAGIAVRLPEPVGGAPGPSGDTRLCSTGRAGLGVIGAVFGGTMGWLLLAWSPLAWLGALCAAALCGFYAARLGERVVIVSAPQAPVVPQVEIAVSDPGLALRVRQHLRARTDVGWPPPEAAAS